MMLKSEIAGGVAGRSTTNLTHDNHVNNQRHDHEKRDNVNLIDDMSVKLIPTNAVDSSGDHRDRSQTDDDFLRSVCRTQLCCLFTYIVSFQL